MDAPILEDASAGRPRGHRQDEHMRLADSYGNLVMRGIIELTDPLSSSGAPAMPPPPLPPAGQRAHVQVIAQGGTARRFCGLVPPPIPLIVHEISDRLLTKRERRLREFEMWVSWTPTPRGFGLSSLKFHLPPGASRPLCCERGIGVFRFPQSPSARGSRGGRRGGRAPVGALPVLLSSALSSFLPAPPSPTKRSL
jgi:hypothetical protein